MGVRGYLKILLAEAIVAISVVLLFQFFSLEKRIAGLLAGALFVFLGVLILWYIIKSKRPWRSATFYVAWVHLLGTTLPVIAYRLIYFSKDFTQIRIFGVPGHVFHYGAQQVYYALMLATIFDLLSTWLILKLVRERR